MQKWNTAERPLMCCLLQHSNLFSFFFFFFSPEEEISNMRSELDKYGIQMPAFSKIGGILASELSVDEAACESAFSCSVFWTEAPGPKPP